MPIANKIEAKDFYKNLPTHDHETGDIWLNIPCWGVAGLDTTSGIVITPACDLSQKKAETLLVLPIIPIVDYLLSKAFFFDIWAEVGSKVNNAGANVSPSSRFSNPDALGLRSLLSRLEESKKQEDLIDRTKAYLDYVVYTEVCREKKAKLALPNVESIIGKRKYEEILKKMFTNSYKTDVHFFPAFKNAGAFSAVPVHSLALFRHAYSIPVEILDAAQASSDDWWAQDCDTLLTQFPIASAFGKWPVKASALKDDFLSDLISRYLSMFMRLGSRDFTSHTLNGFVSELKGVN